MLPLRLTPIVRPLLAACVVAPLGVYLANGAPTANAQDETEAERAQRYFATADYDGSGWISIEEAGQSLLISREEFYRYDANKDGGIDSPEFESRYRTLVETQGFFDPPIPPPTSAQALPTPLRIWFQRFDRDGSGDWDLLELTNALEERGVADLANAQSFALVDADGSGRLDTVEVQAVLDLVAITGTLALVPATSIRELFGTPLDKPIGPGIVPSPDRIPGPLPIFDRLDVDGDGACSRRDLRELAFPAALPIRPETLLAALDLDGDGRLTKDEFDRALIAPVE